MPLMNAADILAKIARLSVLAAAARGGARIYLLRDIAALESLYRDAE